MSDRRVFHFNPGNASSLIMTIDAKPPSPNATFDVAFGEHTVQCTVAGFSLTNHSIQLLLENTSYEATAQTTGIDTEASVAAKADRFR